MSDSAAGEKVSVLSNGGVVYPLLIALSILLYTIYENHANIYKHYCSLGKGRFLRELASWMAILFLGSYAYSCLEQSPSTILTVGAALSLQSLLMLQFQKKDCGELSTSGASPVAMLLLALSLVLRLACTTRVSAYLPDDHTGDYIYQLIELFSLINCIREFLVWQDRPEALYVSNRTMNLGFLAVMLSAVAASQCYGDLASRPLTDQAFAASTYVELAAWLFQAEAMSNMRKEQMNVNFLAAATAGVLCRTYFWDLAAVEIAPAKPILMMKNFPTALVSCHIAMCGILMGLCVLCACKRLGVGQGQVRMAPAAPQIQQMQLQQMQQLQQLQQLQMGMPTMPPPMMPVPPQMPAMPAILQQFAQQFPPPPAAVHPAQPMPEATGYASSAKHPYLEASSPPAAPAPKSAPEVFPDLSAELPPGCTQFVPVSSTYENGALTVVYKAM